MVRVGDHIGIKKRGKKSDPIAQQNLYVKM